MKLETFVRLPFCDLHSRIGWPIQIAVMGLAWSVIGLVVVGQSCGQTAEQPLASESAGLQHDENDPSTANDAGDAYAMDPDFVKALNSLDESLKFKPENPAKIQFRVRLAGLVGGMLLGLLAVVFGYLKLNHLTRGFYSGKLQSIAVAVAVLILVLGYFLWTKVLFQ